MADERNDELRSWLTERGCSEAEIDEAKADGRLVVLTLETMLFPGAGERLTAEETTARADTTRSFADDTWRALGYPVAPEGERQFNVEDVEALRTAGAMVELGVAENAVLDVTRVLGASLARVAESVVDVMQAGAFALGGESAGEETLASEARRLVQIDALSDLVDHVFRRQLAATVHRRFDRGGDGEDEARLVVGFADLTGFTSLSADLDDADLNDLVVRFDHQTRDLVADGGGRVVKTIGDEVMFVADTAGQGAEIALDICAMTDEDERLPAVKVGLSLGPVLSVMGDYFGPDVNKAARLTGHAHPSSVLVSQSVHDALVDQGGEDAYGWRNLGRVDLKDLGPTRVWVLRRASED